MCKSENVWRKFKLQLLSQLISFWKSFMQMMGLRYIYIYIYICVSISTSKINNVFETFSNSKTTFWRNNNFHKVSRSFKNNFWQKPPFSESFKKFQKQLGKKFQKEVARINRREIQVLCLHSLCEQNHFVEK